MAVPIFSYSNSDLFYVILQPYSQTLNMHEPHELRFEPTSSANVFSPVVTMFIDNQDEDDKTNNYNVNKINLQTNQQEEKVTINWSNTENAFWILSVVFFTIILLIWLRQMLLVQNPKRLLSTKQIYFIPLILLGKYKKGKRIISENN